MMANQKQFRNYSTTLVVVDDVLHSELHKQREALTQHHNTQTWNI